MHESFTALLYHRFTALVRAPANRCISFTRERARTHNQGVHFYAHLRGSGSNKKKQNPTPPHRNPSIDRVKTSGAGSAQRPFQRAGFAFGARMLQSQALPCTLYGHTWSPTGALFYAHVRCSMTPSYSLRALLLWCCCYCWYCGGLLFPPFSAPTHTRR